MSHPYLRTIPLCLAFCCGAAAFDAAAHLTAGPRPFLLAANEPACSQEAKSHDDQQQAKAHMEAAEADLKVGYHGRCRSAALSHEQAAYRALEALTLQEQRDTNANLKQQRLQAIQQTEAYLRTTEHDVENSLKTDPQGNVGVDVTALDNAMHALDGGYAMATNAEAAPAHNGGSAAKGACEADAGAAGTPEEQAVARLNAARTDLSGKYRGTCRQAAMDLLRAVGQDLALLQSTEQQQASFPNDALKEKQRMNALQRAQQYQQSAVNTVQAAMKDDPQGGHIGVNVTPIDNALATLKANYGS